ncbi:MAG: hypothetical protein Q7R87_01560 [Nanoarchaeota archaeon]|nr:hypothetical protein [Nanoarchaeota archaeon]
MEIKDIKGFILPITSSMYQNISNRNKAVFCKFMPFQRPLKYLKSKQRLFFYFSGGLIGKSNITSIKMLKPKNILDSYSKELLISPDEFNFYTEGRLNRKMLVLFINNISIFKKKIGLVYPVTTSGRYMTKNEYNNMKK